MSKWYYSFKFWLVASICLGGGTILDYMRMNGTWLDSFVYVAIINILVWGGIYAFFWAVIKIGGLESGKKV